MIIFYPEQKKSSLIKEPTFFIEYFSFRILDQQPLL